eukprot:TRINITY_DN3308_c0_g1_i1.p2 TRINITY_DN3308_c0_g1~~TRINITY_DN3308_c0_g1_i1.p2  ORF type:complete len:61 (+),score=7.25 TRINITY_DN3308_c0_g1_i1:281-463(+)
MQVVCSDPDLIKPHLQSTEKVEWIQSEWAGNEHIIKQMRECDLGHIKLSKIAGVFWANNC